MGVVNAATPKGEPRRLPFGVVVVNTQYLDRPGS